MMEPVDTFEHAGLGVRIRWEEYDTSHANPRDDDGKIGVMFCEYPRYTLGDQDAPDPRDHVAECDCLDEDDEPNDDCVKCGGIGERRLGIVEYLKREHGARVILPLFVYEHGMITMSAGGRLDTGEDNFRSSGRFMGDGAGWDTSSVGVIFDTTETRAQLSEEWQNDDEKLEAILREEVEYYDAYLQGSVFGYEIVALDEDGEVPEDDGVHVLDSCWGFLELNVHSDDAHVREEARGAAECEAGAIEREKQEALRWACADVVTV